MDGANDAADVVAQHFAEDFVGLGDVGPAPHTIAKLGLDSHERALHIAALVVMLHKLVPVVAVEVEHARPERVLDRTHYGTDSLGLVPISAVTINCAGIGGKDQVP